MKEICISCPGRGVIGVRTGVESTQIRVGGENLFGGFFQEKGNEKP